MRLLMKQGHEDPRVHAGAFSLCRLLPALVDGRQRQALLADLRVRKVSNRRADCHVVWPADVQEAELVKLNHDLNVDSLREGQTILLPAGKLSGRDREILNGIGAGTYRTYPVRAGERMGDIISKRGITVAEIEALNPSINIDDLKGAAPLLPSGGPLTMKAQCMFTRTTGRCMGDVIFYHGWPL